MKVTLWFSSTVSSTCCFCFFKFLYINVLGLVVESAHCLKFDEMALSGQVVAETYVLHN